MGLKPYHKTPANAREPGYLLKRPGFFASSIRPRQAAGLLRQESGKPLAAPLDDGNDDD
jgi:hypothetical protein